MIEKTLLSMILNLLLKVFVLRKWLVEIFQSTRQYFHCTSGNTAELELFMEIFVFHTQLVRNYACTQLNVRIRSARSILKQYADKKLPSVEELS